MIQYGKSDLIRYCLPNGSVQRDTRQLKKANQNIVNKKFIDNGKVITFAKNKST